MSKFNFAVSVLIQLLCLRLEFAAQPQTQETKPGTATVSGQVVLNGATLGDVTVVLRPERPTSREEAKGFEVKSDDEGKYRITGVAAGHYYINVLATGVVLTGGAESIWRGKRLTIAAGENLENINLELRREGIITGRVTDSNGNPVAREEMELIKLAADGKPQHFNHPRLKTTDEHGVYRITGLPEGRYLISIGISPEENTNRPQFRTSSYLRTFHPGVTDQSQARPVQVAEGFEATDVNISGVVAKMAYEISGRVVYADTGEPAEGVMVTYGAMSKDRGVMSGWRPSKERSNVQGEFQIQGLAAGKYAIYAYTLPKYELFSDPLVYEITENGIRDVELRIHRGGSISGSVVIEGSNDKAALAKLSQLQISGYLGLEKARVQFGDPTGINSDGNFHIKGLQSGKVKLSLVINPKLGGFLVKRVERDGVPQPDGIEISPGENILNVRVVVEYGHLTLRGEVKIVGGNLPPNQWVIANATRLNQSPPITCGVNVDARGLFIFENLVPGEYEVRLVGLRYQPGEPGDKSLSKLISDVRQKVSLTGANQAPITLVIDLGKKEGNQ